MEHDLRCDQQDADLRQVIDRTQQLVLEKHAHDLAILKNQNDIALLCQRVPVDIAQQLATLIAKHDMLHADFKMMRSQWYYFIGLVCTGFVAGLVAFVVNGGLKP